MISFKNERDDLSMRSTTEPLRRGVALVNGHFGLMQNQ
jgi:hypothetical protein